MTTTELITKNTSHMSVRGSAYNGDIESHMMTPCVATTKINSLLIVLVCFWKGGAPESKLITAFLTVNLTRALEVHLENQVSM